MVLFGRLNVLHRQAFVLALLLSAFAEISIAQSEQAFAFKGPTKADPDGKSSDGIWQYAAIDGGYARLTTDLPGEIKKTGGYYAARTVISFRFPYSVIEGGGGVFLAAVEGDEAGRKQAVSVAAPLASGGLRLSIGPVECGLAGQWIFGTETDFGPVEEANEHNVLIGGELIVSPRSYQNWRLAASYLTDQTIKDRNLTIVTLGLQWGFKWSAINMGKGRKRRRLFPREPQSEEHK